MAELLIISALYLWGFVIVALSFYGHTIVSGILAAITLTILWLVIQSFNN